MKTALEILNSKIDFNQDGIIDRVETIKAMEEYAELKVKEALSLQQPLSEKKQKAIDIFNEVCNEPIPSGDGKEYLNGMIKMKAFLAGRMFEYEKIEALSQQPTVAVAWESDLEKELTAFLNRMSHGFHITLYRNAFEISEQFVKEYKGSVTAIDMEEFLKWYNKTVTGMSEDEMYFLIEKDSDVFFEREFDALTFTELIAKYNEYLKQQQNK